MTGSGWLHIDLKGLAIKVISGTSSVAIEVLDEFSLYLSPQEATKLATKLLKAAKETKTAQRELKASRL